MRCARRPRYNRLVDDRPRATATPHVPLPLGTRMSLVAETLRCYTVARVRIKRDSLPTVLAALRDQPAVAHQLPVGENPYRLSAVVQRVLRRLPSDTRCLMQSLTLLSMLERRGTHSTLVIGVTNETPFGAHAWIELEGRPLLRPGQQDRRLAEL